MIRLVALDMDGTLLTSRGEVSPAVRAAVQQAADGGIHVTVATGRRLHAARAVAELLGFGLPLILHGGAVVQESATGQVVYEDAMSPATVRDAVRLLQARGHAPMLYESPAHGGRLLVGPPGGENAATGGYLESREGIDTVVRLAPDVLPAEHVLSIMVLGDETPMRHLYDELAVAFGGRVSLLFERPVTATSSVRSYGVELFNSGTGKGKALAHLADALGVTLAETMAVGDFDNDLSMLDAVRNAGGVAVAMANAVPLIKGAAPYHVASNDADGVAEAFARFVFGGER